MKKSIIVDCVLVSNPWHDKNEELKRDRPKGTDIYAAEILEWWDADDTDRLTLADGIEKFAGKLDGDTANQKRDGQQQITNEVRRIREELGISK